MQSFLFILHDVRCRSMRNILLTQTIVSYIFTRKEPPLYMSLSAIIRFLALMIPVAPVLQAGENPEALRPDCVKLTDMVEDTSLRLAHTSSLKQELVSLLQSVTQSGDLLLRSEHGYTVLHAACFAADINTVDMLLAAGTDVNAASLYSPLMMLLKHIRQEDADRRLVIAEKLLNAGADPDGNRGNIFWCMPYNTDFSAQAQLLLLKYGNQNMAERTKDWPIYWRLLDLSVIRILLEGGVDPNSHVGEKGMTLLGNLLMRPYDADLVALALKKGASVKANKRIKYYFNDYPFMIRAYSDVHPETAAEIMTHLLDAGCDIDGLNRDGESLRIHYGKIKSAAAAAIGEVLRARGAKLHPDASSSRK